MPMITANEHGNERTKARCPDLSRKGTAFLAVSRGKVGAPGLFSLVAPAAEDPFRPRVSLCRPFSHEPKTDRNTKTGRVYTSPARRQSLEAPPSGARGSDESPTETDVLTRQGEFSRQRAGSRSCIRRASGSKRDAWGKMSERRCHGRLASDLNSSSRRNREPGGGRTERTVLPLITRERRLSALERP